MATAQIGFLLSFLVTFQLLFVGVFLITHRKGNRRNNLLLGAIFLLIGWNLADMTLRVSGLAADLGFFQLIAQNLDQEREPRGQGRN